MGKEPRWQTPCPRQVTAALSTVLGQGPLPPQVCALAPQEDATGGHPLHGLHHGGCRQRRFPSRLPPPPGWRSCNCRARARQHLSARGRTARVTRSLHCPPPQEGTNKGSVVDTAAWQLSGAKAVPPGSQHPLAVVLLSQQACPHGHGSPRALSGCAHTRGYNTQRTGPRLLHTLGAAPMLCGQGTAWTPPDAGESRTAAPLLPGAAPPHVGPALGTHQSRVDGALLQLPGMKKLTRCDSQGDAGWFQPRALPTAVPTTVPSMAAGVCPEPPAPGIDALGTWPSAAGCSYSARKTQKYLTSVSGTNPTTPCLFSPSCTTQTPLHVNPTPSKVRASTTAAAGTATSLWQGSVTPSTPLHPPALAPAHCQAQSSLKPRAISALTQHLLPKWGAQGAPWVGSAQASARGDRSCTPTLVHGSHASHQGEEAKAANRPRCTARARPARATCKPTLVAVRQGTCCHQPSGEGLMALADSMIQNNFCHPSCTPPKVLQKGQAGRCVQLQQWGSPGRTRLKSQTERALQLRTILPGSSREQLHPRGPL